MLITSSVAPTFPCQHTTHKELVLLLSCSRAAAKLGRRQIIIVDFRSGSVRLFAFFISFKGSRKQEQKHHYPWLQRSRASPLLAKLFPDRTTWGTFNGLWNRAGWWLWKFPCVTRCRHHHCYWLPVGAVVVARSIPFVDSSHNEEVPWLPTSFDYDKSFFGYRSCCVDDCRLAAACSSIEIVLSDGKLCCLLPTYLEIVRRGGSRGL